MKHTPGQTVNVYADPMEGTGFIDKAVLIKQVFKPGKNDDLEYWYVKYCFSGMTDKAFILRPNKKAKFRLLQKAGVIR